jgi:hypothetical protein
MRFGTFVFSLSSAPTQDHQVIEQTLREVELAEAIGMDGPTQRKLRQDPI